MHEIKVLSAQSDSELELINETAKIKLGKNSEKAKLLKEKFEAAKTQKEDLVKRSNEILSGKGNRTQASTEGERHSVLQGEIFTLTRALKFLKDSFEKYSEELVGEPVQA